MKPTARVPDGLIISLQRREVRRGGDRLAVNSRVFELLLALAERPGQVVGVRELMARLWPGRDVDEANLRNAVNALRRALARPDAKVVVNVPGRGYLLAEPVLLAETELAAVSTCRNAGGTIGRDQALVQCSQQLRALRFVTIIGPGGIGKTALAHALAATFSTTTILELARVRDPDLVLSSLGAALGLATPTTEQVAASLQDKGGLLIFDNCEHLIDVVAALAEALFLRTSGLTILATSREPLRVAGESVFPLPALAVAPANEDGDGVDIRSHAAVALFIDRANAITGRDYQSPADLSLIAQICRRLDGLPLVIELAAMRTHDHDLGTLAGLLERPLDVLSASRRAALPQHQSLRALVQWSYELLSADERLVLRRLARFPGAFTLAAAERLVGEPRLSGLALSGVLADLLAKSLLVASPACSEPSFRLLETTRAFALEKLEADGKARRGVDAHPQAGVACARNKGRLPVADRRASRSAP